MTFCQIDISFANDSFGALVCTRVTKKMAPVFSAKVVEVYYEPSVDTKKKTTSFLSYFPLVGTRFQRNYVH